MKCFRMHLLAAAGALLLAGNATANDSLWFGAKVGSLGIGVEGIWRPIPWLDFRAGINQFDYEDDGAQAGIAYNATLELQTTYATANFLFPISPMRLTVGAFDNGNEFVLESQEAAFYNVGGSTFSHDQVGTLRGRAWFDSPSPYVGIGFDFELVGRLGLNLDLGVLLQDEPLVSLSSDGSLANEPTFQDALENERQELLKETEDFKAWPVVSLGLHFNFL
ncbi:MAG: hypothetical protein WD078_07825 [Woeseia sp.]